MKILLTNAATTKNKGDAAIVGCMIRDLSARFPNSEIVLESSESFVNDKFFEGRRLIHSMFYYAVYRADAKLFKAMHTLHVFVAVFIWSSAKKLLDINFNIILPSGMDRVMLEYANSDIIIPVGGGYLSAKSGFNNTVALILQSLPFILGKVLGKPVVAYPQSIGPFGNIFQERVVRFTVSRIDKIFVRENISNQQLLVWGINKDKFDRAFDAAFYSNTNTKDLMSLVIESMSIDRSVPLVGITVRDWFSLKDQDYYESEIAKFIEKISKTHNILLLPQVTDTERKDDDRFPSKRIAEKLKNNKRLFFIEDEFSYDEMKGLYDNLDYLVGTRMHSNIFALTSGIPCIAIAYEYKTQGIMDELGLGEWVVDIGSLSHEKLLSLFQSLINKRSAYLEILESKLEKLPGGNDHVLEYISKYVS